MALSLKVGSWELKMGRNSALPMNNRPAGGRWGNRSFWYGLLPGAKVDYQRIAGDRWKNSIIAASLGWIGRNLPQAPPCVYRQGSDGKESIDHDHPLTDILLRPNKFYDGRTLRQATMLSLIAGGGNAYWWVRRANNGQPLEIWYLPHFDCWPMWQTDSTTDNWITGYAYRNGGEIIILPNDAVIHFRDGLDPENQRMGLDPLKSGAREIVADNENAGYCAALLKNMGVPGALITPKDTTQTWDDTQAQELKVQYEEATQGDNRGRPMVLSGPVDVTQVAISPQEMLLDTIPQHWEARLCALTGINPVVLGLPSGLEHSTYSNMEEARRAAWEDGIIPRLELINSELDTQLLAFYPGYRNRRVGCDYRRVLALQDSQDDLFDRITKGVVNGWLTPDEGRELAGYKPIEGGDKLYLPKGAGGNEPDADDSGEGDAPPDKTPTNGNGKKHLVTA